MHDCRSIPDSYALTRLEFKGRNILFLAFVATMMVPSHVTLIPNYKIVVDAHLANTYTALFLTSMFTGTNAFNIFFFRQYFLSIPKDLENAAIVDGCSRLGVFFKIVLPNAKPAMLQQQFCRSAVFGTHSSADDRNQRL